MGERAKAGAIISTIGAIVGILGVFAVFLLAYEPMMAAEMEAGRPDEALIVRHVIPFLSDIGIIGGGLWAVAAYGFFRQQRWAWTLAVTANVMSLVTGFFAMIPAMSRGLFPLFLFIFLPNLVTYVLLLAHVRQVERWVIALSFLSGITYVLSFMNGVASTDKIILTSAPIYIAVQRVSWVGAIAWAVFTVALLHRRKWVLPLGLGASLMTITAGVPLAVVTTIDAGRFSGFSPAPILALALIIILFAPATNRALVRRLEGSA
jgi:hypothetical protein